MNCKSVEELDSHLMSTLSYGTNPLLRGMRMLDIDHALPASSPSHFLAKNYTDYVSRRMNMFGLTLVLRTLNKWKDAHLIFSSQAVYTDLVEESYLIMLQ